MRNLFLNLLRCDEFITSLHKIHLAPLENVKTNRIAEAF